MHRGILHEATADEVEISPESNALMWIPVGEVFARIGEFFPHAQMILRVWRTYDESGVFRLN